MKQAIVYWKALKAGILTELKVMRAIPLLTTRII